MMANDLAYAGHPDEPWYPDPSDLLGVERPPSMARKVVEGFLYLALLNSTFMFKTNVAFLPGLGGIILLIAGGIGLAVQIAQGERLPISYWFAVAMALSANVLQALNGVTPLLGDGLREFIFWTFQMAMICYLVRNQATEKRILVFMTLLVIVSVWLGGEMYGHKDERLRLEQFGVGSSFGNANQLATLSGLFAVSFLFWSLDLLKSLRWFWAAPVLWVLAGSLVIILFRTVSRSGLGIFLCGCLMLVVTVLIGRGVRLAGIVLVVIVAVAASNLAYMVSGSLESLEYRLGRHSIRANVYSWQTVDQLKDTILLGTGPKWATVSSAGVTAHNSFIHTHIAFGGPTAYLLLVWMGVLGWRLTRMLFSRDLPLPMRMKVVTLFGMALGDLVFANQAYMHLSVLFALGLTDKYTTPYSRRSLRERRAALAEQWEHYAPAQPGVLPA